MRIPQVEFFRCSAPKVDGPFEILRSHSPSASHASHAAHTASHAASDAAYDATHAATRAASISAFNCSNSV